MTDGLITRIGKWIDRCWESTVVESQLQEQESKCSERHIGALAAISEAREFAVAEDLPIGKALADTIKQLCAAREEIEKLQDAQLHYGDAKEKELADLKTRMEKIELYTGITRKIDPTKPAVAKSAFSM